MKENALGECQGCDLNYDSKVNCHSCNLSFDNECVTCGPFSNPSIPSDLPPTCACSDYTKNMPVNGEKQ